MGILATFFFFFSSCSTFSSRDTSEQLLLTKDNKEEEDNYEKTHLYFFLILLSFFSLLLHWCGLYIWKASLFMWQKKIFYKGNRQERKSSVVYEQSNLVEYVNEIICHSNGTSIDLVSFSTVCCQHVFLYKVRLECSGTRSHSCLFSVDFGSMHDEIKLLFSLSLFCTQTIHTLIWRTFLYICSRHPITSNYEK